MELLYEGRVLGDKTDLTYLERQLEQLRKHNATLVAQLGDKHASLGRGGPPPHQVTANATSQ